MSDITYVAHANRKCGDETSFNMPYKDKTRAVTRLIDIIVDELGNGEGDLKSNLPEIAETLYSGNRYSYADCKFWIETIGEKKPEDIGYVWVLAIKNGDEESVTVFKEWDTAIAYVGAVINLGGGFFSYADNQTLVETNRLSKLGLEIKISMQEVILPNKG